MQACLRWTVNKPLGPAWVQEILLSPPTSRVKDVQVTGGIFKAMAMLTLNLPWSKFQGWCLCSRCWRVITGHRFSSRFTVVRYGMTWHEQRCACSHVSSCFTSTTVEVQIMLDYTILFWWKKRNISSSQGLKLQKSPKIRSGKTKKKSATLMAIFIYQMLSLCSSKTLPFMKLWLSSTRAAFKDVRIWKALCQRLPAGVRIKGNICHIQSCLPCCAQQKRVWPLTKTWP